MNRFRFVTLISLSIMTLMTGCASSTKPLATEDFVDLPTFMGTWYVVAYTPIIVDKEAHNPTEHYFLDEKGRVQTTYQFRDGGFDGPLKTYTPTGFIYDRETNAEWRMQFIWPFKADYLILHYDPEKGETIIGHPNRKYAWVMLRRPVYDEADYQRLLGMLEEQGFNMELIIRAPQDWDAEQLRLELMRSSAPRAIRKSDWKAATRER